MPKETSESKNFYFNRGLRRVGIGSSRHYHKLFEIYYMKDGSCNTFVHDKVFEVQSGDVILIPAGVVHKTNYTDKPHLRLLINCSEDYIPKSVKPHMERLLYLFRNPEIVQEIEAIFEKIESEWSNPDEFSDEALHALVHSLFFLLARGRNRFSNKSQSSRLVEDCVKYIQKNFMNQITLSETAKLHSVSREHLSRIFKKETGFGFSEFLTLVRLQRAETMLKSENGKTISEIAYACGFNDSNYFSDKFKKAYGIVPSDVKKQYLR